MPEARHHFEEVTKGKAFQGLDSLAASDVILLCTKPADVVSALKQISAAVKGKPVLVISIAAGVSLHTLESAAEGNLRLVRAMPNTPALVRKGAAAYCLGSRATQADGALTENLLGSVGLAIQVPERLMDAVTGLSGSGPAYVYLMIEALADGGVHEGLPRADALQLAAQTVIGAATMVLETGLHPAVLKDMVTSPGGTTIAGLRALEQGNLRASVINAVHAASSRSKELGKL